MALRTFSATWLTMLATSIGVRGAEPTRYAVIIGINDYADAAIPDLKYAESDAKAVYETLTNPSVGRFPKENVALLLGQQATPDAIKSALYKLRAAGKDDLVIVFYSGHGAKEGDEAYWVTQAADAKTLPATALSNVDIRKFLALIPSERLVILLDCCYAASTVKKDLTDSARLFGEFAGKGRVTIAGAAENQEALEYPDKKSGVFTYYLVAGLRGAADANADGVVTFDELWSYLGDNVRKASVKQGGLHEPKIITEQGVTPQFLLTFNPASQADNEIGVAALRQLFERNEITGAQFDAGRTALTGPALTAEDAARREVFGDLVNNRLSPKYLQDILDRRLGELRPVAETPRPGEGKSTLAVVPFDVLGGVKTKDAGAILAERLLPHFAERYSLIDQAQLKRFLEQDDLTAVGLAEVAARKSTKSLSKAVKLRGVRYLVVGSLSGLPDGSLSVTARLCDWQTGGVEAGRVAQISAADFAELVRRLPMLAARLAGVLADVAADTRVDGADVPTGMEGLVARAGELEALYVELQEAFKTLTAKHPRIAELKKKHEELAGPLRKEIEAKVSELRAADAKLAEWYQPGHPQRQALADHLRSLDDLLEGNFWTASTALDKTLTLDLGGGVTMELVLIPEGEFLMGSELSAEEVASRFGGRADDYRDGHPQHLVQIAKPFYMGKNEVTVGQFRQFINATGYITDAEKGGQAFEDGKKGGYTVKPDGGGGWREDATWRNLGSEQSENHPVVLISWNDAKAFCDWLAKKSGKPVRLPTEAEWEYACRAGTTTVFPWGNDLDTTGKLANVADQAHRKLPDGYKIMPCDDGYGTTAPVGSYRENGYKLNDMIGNVWEWCEDWFEAYPGSSTKSEWFGQKVRVVRGGSWVSGPSYCRSADRFWLKPDLRNDSIGFRLAVGTP